MRDYYEPYYELYGRTVELQFFDGTGIASDEVAARADAVRIAEEIQPFVVLGGPALTAAFGDELSARGIMCIALQPEPAGRASTPSAIRTSAASTAARHADAATHVIEFISKQLAGKNAEYAGDEFTSTPRKFGLVYIESSAESAAIADDFVGLLNEPRASSSPSVSRTPRPGDDPGSGGADHRQAEGGRRDDGDLQRRSRSRPATSPARRPPRSTSPSGSSPTHRWSTPRRSPAPTTRSSGSTPSASRS